MKKIFLGAVLLVLSLIAAFFITCLFVSPPRANGQVFVTYAYVTNTITNGPVQNALIIQTNTQFVFLAGRTLQVTNIQTNNTLIGGYGFIFSGFGASNFYVVSGFTNTFPASNGWGTNTIWTTNLPAVSVPVTVIPYGIFSNSLGSNAVLFQ